jgi:hypothetical protein
MSNIALALSVKQRGMLTSFGGLFRFVATFGENGLMVCAAFPKLTELTCMDGTKLSTKASRQSFRDCGHGSRFRKKTKQMLMGRLQI